MFPLGFSIAILLYFKLVTGLIALGIEMESPQPDEGGARTCNG